MELSLGLAGLGLNRSVGLFCRCLRADSAAELRKRTYWAKRAPRFMSFVPTDCHPAVLFVIHSTDSG